MALLRTCARLIGQHGTNWTPKELLRLSSWYRRQQYSKDLGYYSALPEMITPHTEMDEKQVRLSTETLSVVRASKPVPQRSIVAVNSYLFFRKGDISKPVVAGLHTLKINDIIANWKIEQKLGEGGFGAVYKVSDITSSSNTAYALKTERIDSPTKVLKMEVVVLRALKKARGTHCCDILDSGRALGFNFIIMTLVGASLMELRKANKLKFNAFTMGCALSVGLQTLEAIQELHNVGYLHRDLKPANFAVCIKDVRKICLLDFGMCRRYIDNDNAVRRPRWASGFRGTQRYAAISCHISREMARKDDLESWLYQQIELTSGELPWKSLEDTVAICNAKEKSRTTGLNQLFAGCPKEYIHMMVYIDTLRYYDKPNYALIRGLLRDALTTNALSEFPYDWEVDQSKLPEAMPPVSTPVAQPEQKEQKEQKAEPKPS